MEQREQEGKKALACYRLRDRTAAGPHQYAPPRHALPRLRPHLLPTAAAMSGVQPSPSYSRCACHDTPRCWKCASSRSTIRSHPLREAMYSGASPAELRCVALAPADSRHSTARVRPASQAAKRAVAPERSLASTWESGERGEKGSYWCGRHAAGKP